MPGSLQHVGPGEAASPWWLQRLVWRKAALARWLAGVAAGTAGQ